MEEIIKIWLDASFQAHPFITATYWEQQTDDMRNKYIPMSETYVYTDNDKIQGFVSMIDTYLAAIFVSPEKQGNGIGKLLLRAIKEKYDSISLAVYTKNVSAIRFYKREGFNEDKKRIDTNTGEEEIVMTYKRL